MARVVIKAGRIIPPTLNVNETFEKKKIAIKDIASTEDFMKAKKAYNKMEKFSFDDGGITGIVGSIIILIIGVLSVVNGMRSVMSGAFGYESLVIVGVVTIMASIAMAIVTIVNANIYKKSKQIVDDYRLSICPVEEENCLVDVIDFDGSLGSVLECIRDFDTFEKAPMMRLLSKTKGVTYKFEYEDDFDKCDEDEVLTAYFDGEVLCKLPLGRYTAEEVSKVLAEDGVLDFSFADDYA